MTDRPTDHAAMKALGNPEFLASLAPPSFSFHPEDLAFLVETVLPEFIASRQARIESLNAQIGSLPSRVWEDGGEGAGHLEFDLDDAGDEHHTAGCILRILTAPKA